MGHYMSIMHHLAAIFDQADGHGCAAAVRGHGNELHRHAAALAEAAGEDVPDDYAPMPDEAPEDADVEHVDPDEA